MGEVFLRKKKVFSFLMVALSLLGIVSLALGLDYYPMTYTWDFQNYCYLNFNQAMNFTSAPHQGVPYDSSLVGYWNMNEGLGAVVQDASGKGNNGTITGATWVDGKYGTALGFNGNQYVTLPDNDSLQMGAKDFSFFAWIYPTAYANDGLYKCFIGGETGGTTLGLRNSNGQLRFAKVNTVEAPTSGQTIPLSAWSFVGVTFDSNLTSNNLRYYYNGVLVSTVTFNQDFVVGASTNLIGCSDPQHNNGFDGVIDEVRIHNRVLNSSEVTKLFTLNPYSEPAPVSFARYYNFTDSVTGNTMLIYGDNPNANSNNIVLVTCTNFFTDNRLAFQANNSATVNVWTNLGQSAFITGDVWNSENYTTTLTLDASSTAELNWNTYNITTYVDAHSDVSSSNVTVGYGGSQTFNFNASQGYSFNVSVDGVSQGQISSYTFSNVTEPHSVNVTSALLKYTVTASADLGSTISPSGDVSVNYGSSQLLTVQNKTGYNVKHVYVDSVDKGVISNFTFSNVTANHVISVSSESISSTNSSTPSPSPSTTSTATPTPSQSPGQTNSPTPTSTAQPETNQFSTQTVAIVAVAIVVLVAVFALAFKKGFINIEVVDEEKPQETSDNYTI